MAPDGSRYYPAFPYPNFTKLIRDDMLAIRAYLATLTPVSNIAPPPQLRWPLNYRVLMRGWNFLFFQPGIFEPDQKRARNGIAAAIWSKVPRIAARATRRRTYSAPTGAAGATAAAVVQGWFAPRLDSAARSGLKSWSVDDIVEYLQSGRNGRSHAGGLMAEVVVNSTSQMSDADVRAIAVYLKDLPAGRAGARRGAAAAGEHGGRREAVLSACLHRLPRGRRQRRAADLSAAARQRQSAVGRSRQHAAHHPRRRADR